MTDGPVRAIERTADTTYIGGNFTRVGPYTGAFVELDAATADFTPGFPQVDGEVRAVEGDGEGGWYIGGNFTAVNGQPRTNLARIRAGGTLDGDFAPDVDDTVHALQVHGDTIYVGGAFEHIDGEPHRYLRALDVETGAVQPWDIEDPLFSVLSLAVLEGNSETLVAAGTQFAPLLGYSVQTGESSVVRSDADTVFAMDFAEDTGTLYLSFIGADHHVLALDATDGFSLKWLQTLNAWVYDLVVVGGTVYAGGAFNEIDGFSRNGVAALDAASGSVLAWNPDCDGPVYALAAQGDWIYAGGDFTRIGGRDRNHLAALNPDTGEASTWNPDANSVVRCLAASANNIYAGGEFTSFAGVERSHIAALDASTGEATAWNPGADDTVEALAGSGNVVFAGGIFAHIGGEARSHIAALDAGTGDAIAWDPGADHAVYALAAYADSLFVGGTFANIGGAARRCIAALHVRTGEILPWNPDVGEAFPSPFVVDLAVFDNSVYAVGNFTQIGGASRNHAARLDMNGLALPWNPDPDGWLQAVEHAGDTVYIGGFFRHVGGSERNYLSAVDPDSGEASVWNPNPDEHVLVLARRGETLYVGGAFESIGGAFRDGAAAVSTETGFATPWQPPSGVVTTFALHPSVPSLVMGGSFPRHFAEFSLIHGDLNGDGQVNLDDLLLLLDGWGTDYVLDDLLDLLDNWGEGL